MKYYAIKNVGIFKSWVECKEKLTKGSVFKSFSTENEAILFLDGVNTKYEGSTRNEGSTRLETEDCKNILEVYTDGSCISGISGGSAVFKNKVICSSVPQGQHTNNRGELHGIILALLNTTEDVCIYTDSEYSINILSNQYKINKNFDLIEKAKNLMKGRKVIFKHVKAHCGIYYNEIADKYAKYACSNPNVIHTFDISEQK